ncbi:MAG: hypothetical protein WCK67_10430 [bacterium]
MVDSKVNIISCAQIAASVYSFTPETPSSLVKIYVPKIVQDWETLKADGWQLVDKADDNKNGFQEVGWV